MQSNVHDFRNPEETKELYADALKLLEPRLRGEFHARVERLQRESKLQEQALEPIGRLLDKPSARMALSELHRIAEESNSHNAAVRPPRHVSAPGSLLLSGLIRATTGSFRPMTLPGPTTPGTSLRPANHEGGHNVSLAANDVHQNEYGATGILLWVVPQSVADVLLLLPYFRVV
jgi:hypothetical protein